VGDDWVFCIEAREGVVIEHGGLAMGRCYFGAAENAGQFAELRG
jgi:hypothetical protein